MTTPGPQDSPTWPPTPQDRVDPPAPPTVGAGPATRPPRAARRARRIAVVAAGALVVAGAGTAIAMSSGHRVEQREVIPHQITALSVLGRGGDVTVRSGAGTDTVQVLRRGTEAVAEGAVFGAPSWDGTQLQLQPDCTGGCDVDYVVTVPDGVAVTVRTDSGDVEVRGRLGPVALETRSGDIDADVTSSTVTVTTSGGDADLRLRQAPDQLSARSGSGDVDIRVPGGEVYAVTPDTRSGDVDLNVQQGPSGHVIQVQTQSGDISVEDG